MAKADREGLSLGYRIMWRIKYAGLHVFGPAQLGTELRINPFLRSHVPAVARAAQQFDPSTPSGDPVEVLASLRRWKNQF